MLTICIPTYPARQDSCLRLISQLCEHKELSSISVKVSYNGSARQADGFRRRVVERAGKPVLVSANGTDIGGNANILRCVELADTEWVWIIGDDDEARPGALAAIIEDIGQFGEQALAFQYSTSIKQYERQCLLASAEELFRVAHPGNSNLISTNIINANIMKRYLPGAYKMLYTNCVMLSMVLAAIESEGRGVLISNRSVINWVPSPATTGEGDGLEAHLPFLMLPVVSVMNNDALRSSALEWLKKDVDVPYIFRNLEAEPAGSYKRAYALGRMMTAFTTGSCDLKTMARIFRDAMKCLPAGERLNLLAGVIRESFSSRQGK